MTHMTTMRATCLAACLAATASVSAQAEERVLRAGTFLPQQGIWHQPFQDFVDRVNAEGEGLIKIEIVVDPAAMNPFQMGEALANGVIDVLNISGSFYTNLVPEADAHKLFNVPIKELRENGAIELIDTIHREKMNAHFLTRWGEGTQLHIYTSQPIASPRLDGIDMRGTPLYRPFLEALGANIVQMTGSEIYSAMESGVIDGYAWPLWGIGDLGLLDVTKYRIDPGFYSTEISLLVNAEVFDGLSEEQQAFLERQAREFEARFIDIRDEITAGQLALQEEAGIEVITFSGEENREMQQTADDEGWETVLENAPENGAKLKALTYRDPT